MILPGIHERGDRTRRYRRHLGILSESSNYFRMEAASQVRSDQRGFSRSYGRVVSHAVRIELHRSEARRVERDPAGDDACETRAVLFDRRIAASIPRSGESPILGLRAGLGREMRARAEKDESDQMVCRTTIQVQSRPPIGDTLTSARSCLCGVAPCVEAVDATNSG